MKKVSSSKMHSPVKKPRWNIASLVTPFAGALVIVLSYFLFANTYGYFLVIFDYLLFMCILSFGVLFALVSLARRERGIVFSLLALFLNCAPLLWLWAHRHDRLYGP